jgi:hypothetical protein
VGPGADRAGKLDGTPAHVRLRLIARTAKTVHEVALIVRMRVKCLLVSTHDGAPSI